MGLGGLIDNAYYLAQTRKLVIWVFVGFYFIWV